MTTTRYFTEQVLRKRPYLTLELCRAVVTDPLRAMVQDDGRIRHWRHGHLAKRKQAPHLARGDAGRRRDDSQRLSRSRFRRGPGMKLHYYPETDSLYIELSAGDGADVRTIADELNADLDADGHVVGLDVEHASTRLDLIKLDLVALSRMSVWGAPTNTGFVIN